MKQTLFITGITTLALAASAIAEDQVGKGRGRERAAHRATTTTSAHANTGGNVHARQFTAHQNRQLTTHQNNSARSFERRAAVNAPTSTNLNANRVTTRERNFRRAQTTTNNAVVNNTTTAERFNRRQALRDQRTFTGATTNNVTVNRTRNVNRNVAVVNNWRGSQFAGTRYVAFRDYHRAWHDRGWWDTNYGTNLTFVFGAPYFWSAGYWYPAWGYNPGYVYPYDGPIYGAATLSPDQIVMNVQAQLRDDGYYVGPIDGVLGPQTRYALAQFQADNGLAITSAVDQPTLASLGIS